MRKWLEHIGYVSVRTYLVVFLCIILPLFVAFHLICRQYEQYIQNQLSEQIISSISKSEEAVYASFRSIASISSAVVTNPALQEGLRTPNQSYYAINKLFDECVNYSKVNNLYTDDELLLTLFDRQGRCYANWSQNFHDYSALRKEEWVQKAYAEKGHLIWNLFSPSFVMGQTQQLISAARAVYDSSWGDEACGVLIVSMPQSHLSRVLSGFCYAPGDSVYMLGDGDTPILQYAPETAVDELPQIIVQIRGSKEGSFRYASAQGIKLINYYTLESPWTLGEQNLRILHVTDFGPVIKDMGQFSRHMSLVVLASLILTMLIAAVIVRLIVKPVRNLAHRMRNYHLGEPLAGLDMLRRDEIGHLNRSFLRLTDNIQGLFADLDKEYQVKEQYRYESMRSQLNPHFLFNTLNTIRYMSILQHADSITQGIDALSAVLKYSVGHEGEMSQLNEELAHVKGYIAIQNMRFGKRIDVQDDFEPEVLALYTPRFILQPIVENAVIHGFSENTDRPCLIRLYGYVENNDLNLYVEDNGNGIASETVENLNSGTRSKMTGIGFSHVKELLEISFGAKYTLNVQSHPSLGTVVHYLLPVIAVREGYEYEKSADRG